MLIYVFCLTAAGLCWKPAAAGFSPGQFHALPAGEDSLFAAFRYDQIANILSFVDKSSGNPNSWAWDFGDGAASEERDPMHTYSALGNYTVCLTVSRGGTASDTHCEDIAVFSLGTGVEAVEAAFPPGTSRVVSGLEWQIQLAQAPPTGAVWQVLDLQGREVSRWLPIAGETQQQFSAAELPPGRYWVLDAAKGYLMVRALRVP
jgi:hypothetical protein